MTTVGIVIGGTDYVDRVLFSSARFLSQVNGTAGDCYIRLRDGDRTIDIPSGTDILLTVDGEAVWRGYVSQWKKVYVFPAVDVDAFGETRFFDIVGADINVLFAKRIVFNKATPTIVEGKLYPPFQADAPVIDDLVTDYLDLSSDTIDTSTFVDNVGDITEDQEGRAWSAGDTWGQAMQSIAMLPAAIFYLRPTLAGADLVYCDVDTPTAPYAMSDVPSNGGKAFYSDDFGRTVAVGWGTGAIGPWTTQYGDASVSPGHGSLVVGSGGIAQQTTPWPTGFTTASRLRSRMAFTWPSIIDSPDYIELDFIDIPGINYDVYLFVYPDGGVELDWFSPTDEDVITGTSGFTPSPGEAWWAELSWEGSVAKMKAWPRSQAEPDYQLTFSNVPFAISDVPATPVLYINVSTSVVGRIWEVNYIEFEATFADQTTVGYREMEILKDGTGLINDQLAWGMGYGSQTPVFVRDQDGASQALHGLWQAGTVRYGIYKQTTIDRVAASIVEGSPQSKRGAREDRVAVTLATYTPGFLPSQKINFTSEVWGFGDVIPIRKMEVTFEAPEHPKFALTLSHEIDAPFGFIDPFMLNLGFPPIGITLPPLPPITTLGCQCGVTDSASRDVSPTSRTGSGSATGTYLGVPECIPWVVTLQGNASCEVSGGAVKLSTTFTPNTLTESHVKMFEPSSAIAIFNRQGPSPTGPDVRSFTFKLSDLPVNGEVVYIATNLPGDTGVIWINAGTSFPIGVYTQSNISFGVPGVPDATTVFIPNGQWATNVPYTVYAWQDQTHSYIQIVFSSTLKYTASREITGLLTDEPSILYERVRDSPSVTSGNITVSLDDIYIPEFLKCSFRAMLDNFATVSLSGFGGLSPDKDAWYTSDPTPVTPPATSWVTEIATAVTVTTGLTGPTGVNAGQVEFTGASGQSAQKITDATAPWATTDYTITVACQLLAGSAGNVFMRLGFYDDPTSPTTYRVFDFDTTDGTITISTDAESDSFGPVAYQDGLGFIKIHVQRGVICEAKWWFTDDVEPAYMVSVPDDGSTTDTPVFRFEVTGDSPSEVWVLWMNMDYPGKPCFWNEDGSIGFEAQSLQVNPYGYGCEVPQRVDGTHYQCSASMVAGSSKLFINGLRQRRGVEYTETPASGGIVLDAFVPFTAKVFVCYVGAGPLGDAP